MTNTVIRSTNLYQTSHIPTHQSDTLLVPSAPPIESTGISTTVTIVTTRIPAAHFFSRACLVWLLLLLLLLLVRRLLAIALLLIRSPNVTLSLVIRLATTTSSVVAVLLSLLELLIGLLIAIVTTLTSRWRIRAAGCSWWHLWRHT